MVYSTYTILAHSGRMIYFRENSNERVMMTGMGSVQIFVIVDQCIYGFTRVRKVHVVLSEINSGRNS